MCSSDRAMGAVGVAALAWPFIDSLNPAADTLALGTIEVDLSPIALGQSVTVSWRGMPVFIRYRTEDDIAQAREVDISTLPDPQADEDRVVEAQWLIQIGICTHLGCVPLGQSAADPKGDFGGWFCPCHGSHYDTSGRIRRGPAPRNLDIPEYAFIEDLRIRLG